MEIALGAIPKSVSVSGGFLCEQFPARGLIMSFFLFASVSFEVCRFRALSFSADIPIRVQYVVVTLAAYTES